MGVKIKLYLIPPNRHYFKIDRQIHKSYGDLNQNRDVEMRRPQ